MKRRPIAELLDTDSGTPDEITASLRDLQSFNKRLGGVSTTHHLVDRVARRMNASELSMLEVAAGAGYVPSCAALSLKAAGIRVAITLLDRAATHLPNNGTSRKIVGDALTLPFADSTFDIVSSSLFVHHLSPEQVIQFIRESLRVSRIAVLVNDLVRHRAHLLLAYAGVPLYRSRITRNDAPASVKQAYTIQELQEFLNKGGAAEIDARQFFLFRMGVIAWKRVPSA
jgi:ubiquinone/menaquinone biosynthesis C-methylase UbiE